MIMRSSPYDGSRVFAGHHIKEPFRERKEQFAIREKTIWYLDKPFLRRILRPIAI